MSASDLSESEFQDLYQRLKRMSRWGAADRRGALNYISEADVMAAASVSAISLGTPSPVCFIRRGWTAEAIAAAGREDRRGFPARG